jgi:hypothetical protein
MSHATESARVVNVAAGVETTDRAAPVRDGRHEALAVLIGTPRVQRRRRQLDRVDGRDAAQGRLNRQGASRAQARPCLT